MPKAKTFRVVTELRFGNGRSSAAEAVIALGEDKGKTANAAANANTNANTNTNANANSGASAVRDKNKEPFRILSWRDDPLTAPRPLRQAGG